MNHARVVIIPFFLLALGGAYQRAISPVGPAVTTEEGQSVVFDRFTWQYRELAKKLPVAEPWPTGPEMRKAIERFGLNDKTPPGAIPVPARIATDVYLVGQDRVSNLTYMIDCGSEGVAIIDPTYASEFEHTLENIEKCGRSRKDVRWVLNTHCHIDHAMADKQFRDLGAQIAVHEADAAAIEKASQITAYYLIKEANGEMAKFPRCPIDRRLSDGEDLQLGNKSLQVIHTPGHTPGSACFLLKADGKNLLFSGDTVLYDGRLGWQGNPFADNRQYLASLEKLNGFTYNAAKVQWDVLLPGHGAISLDKAYLDVQKDRDLVAVLLGQQREIPGVPFALPEYRNRMYGRPPVRVP
jgi:glyoxylase-like metal-dependent hydrolase (beta-lactamase superfamily II)